MEILEQNQSIIAKDLRLNLQRVLTEGNLDPVESHLALLALATATHSQPQSQLLSDIAVSYLRNSGLTEVEITEAKESAALMAMLNTYYKFKTMIQKPDDYKTANLRMTALAKPSLGKLRFEMLAFAVSVLNGCESCIRSHEEVLRHGDVSVDKIHDLARLAAIVKGVTTI